MTHSKQYIKQLVNSNQWKELGELFHFTPVYLESTAIVSKYPIIDWRCVPKELYSILQKKENHRVGNPVRHRTAPRQKVVLFNVQNGVCHYCGRVIPEDQWSIDHRIPICRGGANHLSNKVGCCQKCNSDKSNLTETEFLAVRNLPTQQARKRMITFINLQISKTKKLRNL